MNPWGALFAASVLLVGSVVLGFWLGMKVQDAAWDAGHEDSYTRCVVAPFIVSTGCIVSGVAAAVVLVVVVAS